MPKEKHTFQVQNVKCEGCANTLKTQLQESFGNITVDLTKMPREITLEIAQEEIPQLREALKKLGYPMSDEALNFVESATTQAKSFVSCAVGKFELAKK